MLKKLLLIFGIIFCAFAFAQAPPAPSMPNESQSILIDELILASNYEASLKTYGMQYMYSKMYIYKNGKSIQVLNEKEATKILNDFDFNEFKNYSIYNAFANVSEENLKLLIKFYKSVNGKIDEFGNLFFNNSVIIENFNGYINTEIETIQKKK
jgi:hypothetical protein